MGATTRNAKKTAANNSPETAIDESRKKDSSDKSKKIDDGDRRSREKTPTSVLEMLLLAGGIYVSFLAVGLSQESLFEVRDFETNNKFAFPVSLVTMVCVLNAVMGAFLVMATGKKIDRNSKSGTASSCEVASTNSGSVSDFVESPNSISDGTFANKQSHNSSKLDEECSDASRLSLLDPFKSILFSQDPSASVLMSRSQQIEMLKEFAFSSVSYIFAMVLSNFALTRVNYPIQVLVKSAKCVPVVLGGYFIFNRKYPLSDYVVVTVTTAALVVFNLSRGKNSAPIPPLQLITGLVALFGALLCDAFTGPRQDRIFARYKPSVFQMMFYLNVFASVIGLICTVPLEGLGALTFSLRNPEVLSRVAGYVFFSNVGQIVIVSALERLGSLHLTLVTTTRKFFTVLLSVICYGHSLSVLQWASVFSIFGAFMGKSIVSHMMKSKKGSDNRKTE